MSRGRGVSVVIAAVVCVLVVVVIISTRGGGSDGPAGFLSHDAESVVFVQWTRVGDDVSGSLSVAEVTQPQAGLFSSTARPAGEIEQQTAPFTGTVGDDSVRLQIGSGALSNRINGRLDGDALELTIPQDQGAETRRLRPSSRGDYTNALQEFRAREQQRKSVARATRVREQRAARTAITRVANAFQKALDPSSPDDPCRYVTPELKEDIRSFAAATASAEPRTAGRDCAAVIRDNERERDEPLYEGPQGVARIDFSDSLVSQRIGEAGPPGAIVTWRPASGRGTRSQSTTKFTEQNGQWLVYRCCL